MGGAISDARFASADFPFTVTTFPGTDIPWMGTSSSGPVAIARM